MLTAAHKFFMNQGDKKSVYKTGGLGTGTTTTITEAGFGKVDGFILYIAETTSTNTWDIDACTFITLCDLTTGSPVYATYGARIFDDADYGIQCDKECYNDKIYTRSGDPSDTTIFRTGTVAAAENGITITWDGNQTNLQYNIIMFGGGVRLHVGNITCHATGGQYVTYSSSPFTPQAGIFISTGQIAFNSRSTSEAFLGFGIFAGSEQQSYLLWGDSAFDVASQCSLGYSNNSLIGPSTNYYTIGNLSSNGFRLTTTSNGAANYFGFILFGDLANYDIVQTNAPSSNSTANYSYGFSPDVLIPMLVGRTTTGESGIDIRTSSGMYSKDNSSGGGFSNYVEDGVYDSDAADRHMTTSLVYIDDRSFSGPDGAYGSLSSINSDGHSIAWTKLSSSSQFLGATLAFKF